VNIKLIHVIVTLLLAPRPLVWGSSEIFWGNGLESDNTSQLDVLIELLPKDAKERKKLGLPTNK
jgi:hypothetical protein